MMVIAVSLGVVLAPYIHHHVTLGQALGVPGAHHLCVLPGVWGASEAGEPRVVPRSDRGPPRAALGHTRDTEEGPRT